MPRDCPVEVQQPLCSLVGRKKIEKRCTPDRQAPAWDNLNGKKDEEEEVA